jgi:hypothetical protein
MHSHAIGRRCGNRRDAIPTVAASAVAEVVYPGLQNSTVIRIHDFCMQRLLMNYACPEIIECIVIGQDDRPNYYLFRVLSIPAWLRSLLDAFDIALVISKSIVWEKHQFRKGGRL